MDNQAKDLKLEKDRTTLSQMRKKKFQKRAGKCKKKRKQVFEENRI